MHLRARGQSARARENTDPGDPAALQDADLHRYTSAHGARWELRRSRTRLEPPKAGAALARATKQAGIECTVTADSTVNRAYQYAAVARKKRVAAEGEDAVDGRGLPLSICSG